MVRALAGLVLVLVGCSTTSSAPAEGGGDASCLGYATAFALCVDAGSINPEHCACAGGSACPPCPGCSRYITDRSTGDLACECCACASDGKTCR